MAREYKFQKFLGTDCRVLHERAMCANERCDDFVCYTGFKKAASSACTGSCKADICEDIDECAAKLCPANANCLNTEGSYLCECKDKSYRGNPMIECVKYWCPGSMWGDGVNCFAMPQVGFIFS